jgi:tetratricopeptide (TPR) repeat protein
MVCGWNDLEGPSLVKMEEVNSETAAPASPMEGQHHDANDYSRFENVSDSDDEQIVPETQREILSFHESYFRCQGLKENGNAAFKENNFLSAKLHYEEALEILKPHKGVTPLGDVTPEKVQEFQSLYLSLHANTSMVHFKEENWSLVIKSTEEILSQEPENVKALYRRAVAHHRLGNIEEAKDGLSTVLALDAANAAAKKELVEVTKALKEQKRKEKSAMSGMFSGGSIYSDREEERQRKIRKEKEAEDRLHDQYLQEKLKKRGEGLPESEVEISFDEWKKAKKKREEEAKKEEEKRQEEERKKRQVEKDSTRKKQKTAAPRPGPADGGEVEYDEEDRYAPRPHCLADILPLAVRSSTRLQAEDTATSRDSSPPKRIASSETLLPRQCLQAQWPPRLPLLFLWRQRSQRPLQSRHLLGTMQALGRSVTPPPW